MDFEGKGRPVPVTAGDPLEDLDLVVDAFGACVASSHLGFSAIPRCLKSTAADLFSGGFGDKFLALDCLDDRFKTAFDHLAQAFRERTAIVCVGRGFHSDPGEPIDDWVMLMPAGS